MNAQRKLPVEKFVVATEKPRTRGIAIASFFAGMFLMWLVLHFFASSASKTPPSTPDAPDVSQMPPAQAAATLANWAYDHANWPAAAQQYERAIAAGLDTPDIHSDLGTAYRNLGDGEKALAQFGIAQRKDPFHQNSLFSQAIVYAELFHDRPRAIAAAREYLRRFPQGRGADGAQKIVAELSSGDAERKLTEFLTAPKPVPATR